MVMVTPASGCEKGSPESPSAVSVAFSWTVPVAGCSNRMRVHSPGFAATATVSALTPLMVTDLAGNASLVSSDSATVPLKPVSE